MSPFMMFITGFYSFIKALPEVTNLINKTLDFIALQQEIQHQKEVNAQMQKEMDQLRAAVAVAQSPTHDNTQLNDLFNGVKK